jgi:hypothetical protein
LKSYCKTKSVRKELACKPNGGWQWGHMSQGGYIWIPNI